MLKDDKKVLINLEYFKEVYVDEEVAKIIEEENRKNENYERKQRRWCTVSIEDVDYEGKWFIDNDTPISKFEIKESQQRVEEFKKTLTPVQLRRLKIKEDNPELSFNEIAQIEKVNVRAVWETFEQIKKKIKNFINDPQ